MDAQVKALRVALVGVPNCGKTALFNRLTGGRQKVANYPGVTVERKEGRLQGDTGRVVRILDLPGTYSLNAATLDEAIARDVILGRHANEPRPDLIVCVLDATNLALGMRLLLEMRNLRIPLVVALNRIDVAEARHYQLDRGRLQAQLNLPVFATVATRRGGADDLIAALTAWASPEADPASLEWVSPDAATLSATHAEVARILAASGYRPPLRQRFAAAADAVVMHPIWGMLVLGVVLFLMFQAVFSWAAWPMALIDTAVGWLSDRVDGLLAPGLLHSLLVDGIIAGVGEVIIFLPQILILFLFILVLEDCGYLPRAAFLLDRVMSSVGLTGRAFIPLLSSFACAIPGIMATRTIPTMRDRLATIMIAPLMTCSARLPVYALLIGAFIPHQRVGLLNLQGLVLFALYLFGVAGAMLVALVLKKTMNRNFYSPLMMELPSYQWPNLQGLVLGLIERARIFLRRVGGIILSLMIILWFLSTYPAPPAGASGPAIKYSFAGMLGRALEVVLAPIGFNWQISLALVPGLAAREVTVGALGTVYAMSGSDESVAAALGGSISGSWPLATALSLLAWFVFAPQCLSTLAVVRRETNTWRYPLIMAAYLFAMAWIAAFITYRLTLSLG
ncbi:MAG: ferrous iron transporter B [Steroidobacteraceae bacterium]